MLKIKFYFLFKKSIKIKLFNGVWYELNLQITDFDFILLIIWNIMACKTNEKSLPVLKVEKKSIKPD